MPSAATNPIPFNLEYPVLSQTPVFTVSTTGASTLANITSGIVHITATSAANITLPAPTVDGIVLAFLSTTAQAHTIIIAAGLGGAGAGADTGTFGGAIYDGCILYSKGGYWWPYPATDVNVTWG